MDDEEIYVADRRGGRRRRLWHGRSAADIPDSNAKEGRHGAHDSALRRLAHQPRHPYLAARPGRYRRQDLASHALQLGLGQGTACARTRQGGRGFRRRHGLHLQAAGQRLLPQWPAHDGRRHHLVVHAHHGLDQGLPGRALRALHQGRSRRREGCGQGNLGPQEDRRLHRGNDAGRAGQPRLPILRRRHRHPAQGRSRERQLQFQPGGTGTVQVRRACAGLAAGDRALG